MSVARDHDERSLRRRLDSPVPRHPRASYLRTERAAHDAAPPVAAALESPTRVAAVDALRGFAMFWIIAGDAFAYALLDISAGKEGPLFAALDFLGRQFTHVAWEGFHFYDLLFPLFIFVIGVSLVFSLSRLVEREGIWSARKRVLRRSLLLFLLGVIYYGGTSNFWPEIRLLGVLQRIALCYLFASLLFLHLNVRGLVASLVVLLVGYWALMTFVPVPGVGAGSFDSEANLARWLDATYLPGLRLYGEWDPEGLLSTLPAIGTCLMGVLAGLLLKGTRPDPMQKALWFAGSGVAAVLFGHLWGLQFPVVKNIWTSSFVLVAGGYSLLLLGLFYLLIDVWNRKGWTPVFLWFGANAITLYMINNLAEFQKMASRLVGGDIYHVLDAQISKGAGALLNIAVGLTLAVMLARYLYRRKIFLRV